MGTSYKEKLKAKLIINILKAELCDVQMLIRIGVDNWNINTVL